uniref:Uncharacterized protein n=1 Tax=Arundo donax TaxID=35708 RepID=A0A0A9EMW4_ARUDO
MFELPLPFLLQCLANFLHIPSLLSVFFLMPPLLSSYPGKWMATCLGTTWGTLAARVS